MYKKIMVPVDLAHIETLQPAIELTADMARHFDAEVCYVGVTSSLPGAAARTPEEYERKLNNFAQEQGGVHGQAVSARVITSSDPIANLDDILIKAIDDTGADLVLMATHLPKRLDAVMPSHGGKIAAHTRASVFLVRL